MTTSRHSQKLSWDPCREVSLSRLALAAAMYNGLTDFNETLKELREKSKPALNLSKEDHQENLMKFLNAWGCRHLSKRDHRDARSAVHDWYEAHGASLFPIGTPLWELDDADLEPVAAAYDCLKEKKAARKSRNGNTSDVHFGPTAASKVLFVLRPEALMPWDDAMRVHFGHDGGRDSYLAFLKDMKEPLLRIKALCESRGFLLYDLPHMFGRQGSTMLEILNEYIYITVTRGCKPPSPRLLSRWAKWG